MYSCLFVNGPRTFAISCQSGETSQVRFTWSGVGTDGVGGLMTGLDNF